MAERFMTKTVWADPTSFIAFGFGSGLLPWMPGTFGTLMAIPFYLLLQLLPWQLYLAVTLAAFAVGIWLCGITEKRIGISDYPGIVWDEMVGFWVTLFLAPASWGWIILGFILFRFFDIVKPWPINWMNKHVHGGVGVMLDDLIAGVFSLIVLQILIRVWLHL